MRHPGATREESHTQRQSSSGNVQGTHGWYSLFHMIGRLSIRQRAALAVLLSVGFYGVAFGVCLLLAGFIMIQFAYGHVFPRVVVGCVVGIAVILKSILPPPVKFQPPGPRLSPSEHPALFARIQAVADATEQEAPADVYLLLDVNAFVTEIGDWTEGPRRTRVMGVGLPLLQALTVGEFTAVLAHEFGHYHAGDTKLGPFIHRTRTAIIRTLKALHERASALTEIFEWYGRLYIRFTQAVSREQELIADRLAARMAGARVASTALRKTASAAAAFGAYMQTEFTGVIAAGYLPPIADGFRMFMESPRIRPLAEQYLQSELARTETNPFDSHPALRDRLAALEALPPEAHRPDADAADDSTAAISLLADVPRMESTLIVGQIADPERRALTPLGWDAVPGALFPQGWARAIQPVGERLGTMSMADVARLARSTVEKSDAVADMLSLRAPVTPTDVPPDVAAHEVAAAAVQRAATGNAILCCAVALSFYRRSLDADAHISMCAPVGDALTFRVSNDVFRPFDLVADLASGTLPEAEWMRLCATAGVSQLDVRPLQVPA
jgi:heat shock protein HtpX